MRFAAAVVIIAVISVVVAVWSQLGMPSSAMDWVAAIILNLLAVGILAKALDDFRDQD